MIEGPTFRVRAAGSFKQKPGCPVDSLANLSSERLDYLCAGECYNPGDERHVLSAIEVIKITPQEYQGEPINTLIHDAWQVFACPNGASFCDITFTDDTFTRDSVYYVRVLQEPTLAINGQQLSIVNTAEGSSVNICKGSYQTDQSDNCLAPAQERAWSSPIYISKP